MDYLSYWHLGARPFENTRNPRYFYKSPVHLEALRRLLYVVHSGNKHFALLTGEIGSGKTLTRTVLERGLDPERYQVVSLENSNRSWPYLLSEINARIRGRKRPALTESMDRLQDEFEFLLSERIIPRNKELVLILDEAQQLDSAALVELKNLTNIASEDRTYVSVILVGQPELRRHVARLPQIDQRISLRFHLGPLQPDEVRAYMRFRLRVAGHPTGDVFSERCYRILHLATKGVPREINRLAELALELGFAAGVDEIRLPILKTLIMDLLYQKGMLEPRLAA